MSEFIWVVSGVGWGGGLAWVGGRLAQIYYVTVGRGLEVIITDSSKGIGDFQKSQVEHYVTVERSLTMFMQSFVARASLVYDL